MLGVKAKMASSGTDRKKGAASRFLWRRCAIAKSLQSALDTASAFLSATAALFSPAAMALAGASAMVTSIRYQLLK